jgi:cardiolipin hydrolase
MDIQIVGDKDWPKEKGGEYSTLKNASLNVRIDNRPGVMHDKHAIIDGRIVITGSFNWSTEANQQNRENLIILNNPIIATIYEQNFQTIWTAGT